MMTFYVLFFKQASEEKLQTILTFFISDWFNVADLLQEAYI